MDADYNTWSNVFKYYSARHENKSWSKGSDGEKVAYVEAALTFTGFKPAIGAYLISRFDFHKKALEALLQDCIKKHSETDNYLAVKRVMKRSDPHGDEAEEDGEEPDIRKQKRAIVFWACDPDYTAHEDNNGCCVWHVRNWTKLDIIVHNILERI